MMLKIKQPFLFALTLAAGMFLGTKLQKNLQKRDGSFSKFEDIINLINKNYVDPVNTDSIYQYYFKEQQLQSDSLETALIETLLSGLDPHSLYIPAAELKQVNEEMKGEFAGIGIEYNILEDTITLINVIPNGPAAKAALLVGDKIIKVQDSLVAGIKISNTRIRNLLRGAENSIIGISVLRNGQQFNTSIQRGIVPIPSIDAAYMIDPQTGFIKLNKFSFSSFREFKTALEQLIKNGMTTLIFDLRGNGGGVLGDAVAIADEFLDAEKLIVYTEGAHQKKQEYYCHEKGLFEKGKLILLVDEQTASASEIVAGALQDWDRATIIGRRTFGKGLVQRQFGFSDRSGVRLTVARYYTPSGRSIQKTYENGKAAYEKDLENRLLHNGLTNADSNKLTSTRIYKTKAGRTIYGGGGITPDLFISIDTTAHAYPEYTAIYEKNILPLFVFKYYLQNKELLLQKYDRAGFAKNFQPDSNLWGELEKASKKENITIGHMPAAKAFLLDKIKQLLAKQLWQLNGYYDTINQKDPFVQKALGLAL